jgi:hypothetical protein
MEFYESPSGTMLNYFWPTTTVAALALPLILFMFLGLAFLVITPHQYLTVVGPRP